MRHVKNSSPKGRFWTVLPNGVIRVAREFKNIAEPYKKESIPNYLGAVDHSLKIESKKEYKKLLRKVQRRFNKDARLLKQYRLWLMSWLMGRDASGKTGSVRVMNDALGSDTQLFLGVSFSKPSDEEQAHPWLWKYQKYNFLPSYGQVRVFDRCPQERVMVERVRQFTPMSDVQHSYTELRMYEWLLVSQGGIFVKIWQDITKEEQKRRFEDREENKIWKKSEDDEIDRGLWDEYTPAANEMIHRTATDYAPQYIISSEDKKYCHIALLEVLCYEMERRIKQAKRLKKQAEKAKKQEKK
ncbi:MAG TPA: hypothetical protein V6C81_02900 [Planktothrix sp.]|jgi:polyphosphate kinase 2 (PPK2 family)